MGVLTVKSVDDAVLRRLARKAASAGLSTQEYVRRLLARDAQLSSADEMVELQRVRQATASDPEALGEAVSGQRARRAIV